MYTTDVLCVGGGIAGLMAAISAKDKGADVIVIEKGNAEFSGRGRSGNDHFWCYIPEVHGADLDSFLKECLKGPKLAIMQSGTPPAVIKKFLEHSFEIVKVWDDWGIPMRNGKKWEFAGHSFPGEVFTHLKYRGKNQKKVLYRKAQERGVKIHNRVMAKDLIIEEDSPCAVLAIHTREEKIHVYVSRAVVLATGTTDRLYPPPVPGWLSSTPNCLTLTGDGRAMALRAGIDIVSPELPKRHMGPKYFARFGQATWVGVLKDGNGKPCGPYVKRPERLYGDMVLEARPDLPEILVRKGRGPVYMDMEGITDEDYEYMIEFFLHEGMASLLDHVKEEGIDLKKDKVEFMTYHLIPEGKIWIDTECRTSKPQVFAAGDEVMVGVGPAATLGWIAGQNAASLVNKVEKKESMILKELTARLQEFLAEIRNRKVGATWFEANICLQQIMWDYAGTLRYENLLCAGYENLKRLKEKFYKTATARNQWEVARVLEVFNLLDLAEIVFLGAIERKESRGFHKRMDYPFLDPSLNEKGLFFRKEDGKLVYTWKRI
ncbi:MAG: FAD-binding protein [Deltaproteobacteria bacterium]|nr:FAD-binding protein [Deltaproteobacteria bacterium]